MELVRKSELPLVPYQGMNQVHYRELDYLNSLYRAVLEGSEEEVTRAYEEFLEDVKEHFSYEEELMRKSHFFAYECHSSEHKRVLEELSRLKERWLKTKDREFLRRYLEESFKPWIVEHIMTMDTVTGEWLSRVIVGVNSF